MELEDGSYYQGVWENGTLNGFGKMHFEDGSFYEGNWQENIMSGNGICSLSNGYKYEGEWKNGRPDGVVRITFDNKFWIDMLFLDGKHAGIQKSCNIDEF